MQTLPNGRWQFCVINGCRVWQGQRPAMHQGADIIWIAAVGPLVTKGELAALTSDAATLHFGFIPTEEAPAHFRRKHLL